MTDTQQLTQMKGDHRFNSSVPAVLFPNDFNNIKEAEEKRIAKLKADLEAKRAKEKAEQEANELMKTEQGRAQALKNALAQVASLTIENSSLQEKVTKGSDAEIESKRLLETISLDRDKYQKELSALKQKLPWSYTNDLPRHWDGVKVYIINSGTGLALDCFPGKHSSGLAVVVLCP